MNAVPVVRTTSEFNRTATLFGIGAYDPVNVPATQYDDLAFAQADPSPLLDLSVLTSADPVTVGQQVAFTMTVTNNGDAPANSVGLDETFPAQISIDSAVPTQGTCTPTVTTVTCELGALAPNNIANVVVTGTVQEQGIARTQATASVNATPHSTVTTAITTLAAIPDPANPDPAVFDTFSGAPQSGLGVADSGHLWLEHVGEWGVDGGHAAQATTGVGIATVDAGGAFGYYDVVVADVVDEFWVVFHLTDELNYWRFGRHAGGEYLLQRVEAGFIQTWGLTFGNATPADGDHIRIVLTSDDGINAYVNGNWIRGTGTLFNMNATRLGVATIRLPGLPSTRFDLVHWTPFTDDFPEPPDPHG